MVLTERQQVQNRYQEEILFYGEELAQAAQRCDCPMPRSVQGEGEGEGWPAFLMLNFNKNA